MSRCTTREPVRHYYKACMDCPECSSLREKQCKRGYDVFYFRKSKDNHCDKCLQGLVGLPKKIAKERDYST